MGRNLRIGVAVVALFAAALVVIAAKPGSQVFDGVKSAVLYVRSVDSANHVENGTGFIIDSSGYALTARHVILPKSRVYVVIGSRTGEQIEATVVPEFKQGLDVAVLKLPQSHGPYRFLKLTDPLKLRTLDDVITVGFPGVDDRSSHSVADLFPTPGSLANTDGPTDTGMWSLSMEVYYGNSGGPVLDGDGNVVGLVQGGESAEKQISYMIPSNLLCQMVMTLDRDCVEQFGHPATGVDAMLKALLDLVNWKTELARGVAADANHRNIEARNWAAGGQSAVARAVAGQNGYGSLIQQGQTGIMRYRGEIKQNGQARIAQGVGERVNPDGGVYLGQFQNNSASGSGLLTAPNGRQWSGIWGGGTFIFGVAQPDPTNPGLREKGKFAPSFDGQRLTGLGCIENGMLVGSPAALQCGEFKDGQLTGYGTVTFADGTVWKGQWQNGKLSGLGAKFRNGATTPYEQGSYVSGTLRSR